MQPGGEYVKYLIGVDIGTQGTKAALYDENMTLAGTRSEERRVGKECS